MTREMWSRVVNSELGPQERKAAEAMGGPVTAYLAGEIDAEEYARQLGRANVPQP